MNKVEFLQTKRKYQLGFLPTEQAHPLTGNLSEIVHSDTARAVDLIRQVDQAALDQLANAKTRIMQLHSVIHSTLRDGGKVFLCGCGATGRLSLGLDQLFRKKNKGSKLADATCSFMAGGDVALVHALEGFEDYPELGRAHLEQLGFGSGDLLISCTEGGETPFVIGATIAATELSSRPPWFLYCNPRELLIENIERSRRVLTDEKVEDFCIDTGPMALAGSTRMQASTVLMLAVGLALLFDDLSEESIQTQLKSLRAAWLNIEAEVLAKFVQAEADIYASGNHSIYSADEYALTVMTDTTERAPTFNLAAFNNQAYPQKENSLTYLTIPGCVSSRDAWEHLLMRPPRHFRGHSDQKTTESYLLGFDFSQAALPFRRKLLPSKEHRTFEIFKQSDSTQWRLGNQKLSAPLLDNGLLLDQILMKMALNTHSTLLMGLLGRYEGNLMTWVRPTNGKLIDRATRYVLYLLDHRGISHTCDYDQVVEKLFEKKENISQNHSLILEVVKEIKTQSPQPS